MASLASKNLYELLGNDPELDPERATPKPPTVVKDNPVSRVGKRDGPAEHPAAATGAPATRGGRRGGRDNTTGNERAYRDRDAGATENRRRAPDDGLREDRHPDRIRADRGDYRGRGRGRGASGGRGLARGAGRPDDRHSKTGVSDHDKQVAHGWGGQTGNDEWNDEKAGEAIAKEEEKGGFDTDVAAPVDADGNTLDADKPEEPEEPQTKGLVDYLAEQAEKKLALNEGIAIRKPNEGASKKFPEGKPLSRDQEEEDFIAGSGGKKTRERAKKEKTVLELDGNAMRPEQREERPSRGGRGGRGRGDRPDRGDRPERSDRPERGERLDRGERGEYRGRGGRGRGEGTRGRGEGGRGRGEFRGRGGARGQSGPNVDDQSAFPSLGA